MGACVFDRVRLFVCVRVCMCLRVCDAALEELFVAGGGGQEHRPGCAVFEVHEKVMSGARRTSHVACRMSHVARRTSHVARRTSHVARRTSHVARHTSHITHHTSHVTRLTQTGDRKQRNVYAGGACVRVAGTGTAQLQVTCNV